MNPKPLGVLSRPHLRLHQQCLHPGTPMWIHPTGSSHPSLIRPRQTFTSLTHPASQALGRPRRWTTGSVRRSRKGAQLHRGLSRPPRSRWRPAVLDAQSGTAAHTLRRRGTTCDHRRLLPAHFYPRLLHRPSLRRSVALLSSSRNRARRWHAAPLHSQPAVHSLAPRPHPSRRCIRAHLLHWPPARVPPGMLNPLGRGLLAMCPCHRRILMPAVSPALQQQKCLQHAGPDKPQRTRPLGRPQVVRGSPYSQESQPKTTAATHVGRDGPLHQGRLVCGVAQKPCHVVVSLVVL